MKKFARVGFRTRIALALCTALFASSGVAQSYPTKPIRMVVAFAPGGVGDLLARMVGQKMSERYKQPVIVENRPGASGTIGADVVARSAPDGYTVLVTNQLVVQAAGLYQKLPYDPIRDFTPVTDLITSPLWFAVNSAKIPSKTLPEFIDLVKRNPNQHSWASVGLASIGHLYGVRLNEAAGIDLLHVPYKGSAPVVAVLVAGETSSAFSDFATMKPHIESGRVRLLAISKTSRSTPDIPTFASLGYTGFESYSWVGMLAPSKTPTAIVQELAAEVARILKLPDVAAKLADMGLDPGGMPQAQFTALVASDLERWTALMKRAGIKAE